MFQKSCTLLRVTRPFLGKAAHVQGSQNTPVSVDSQVIEEKIAPTITPESALRSLRQSIAKTQKDFFTPADCKTSYTQLINDAYDGRMQQEQQVEIESYVAKRRIHYDQRLDEETEEFRRERREVYDEMYRIEVGKYKDDIGNDIGEYSRYRQKECEASLKKDIEKYHSALRPYRSRNSKSGSDFGTLSKNLTADVASIVSNLEPGELSSLEGSEDINDDITSYVNQRLRFYETMLEADIEQYTQRRKAFYEELLQARSLRHAAKIRSETDTFRSQRHHYYEDKLGTDALWVAKAFRDHYEQCFLQCYARQTWLAYQKNSSIHSLANINIEELNRVLPLTTVLDIYKKEALEETTRDIFLKAARRVADDVKISE